MPTEIKLVLPGLTQYFRSNSLLPFRQVNYLITTHYTIVSAIFHNGDPSIYVYTHLTNTHPIRFISDTLCHCYAQPLQSITLIPLRAYPNHFPSLDVLHFQTPTTPPSITTTGHPFEQHILDQYGF